MLILLLLIIGLIAGILAGLFGVGGGIIFTPILFFIFSASEVANPVPWTIGSSLFCTFAASLSSTIRQRQQHNFYIRQGLKVGLFGVAGVYLGKQIVTSAFYTEQFFTLFFTALLVFVAFIFYRRGHSDAPQGDSEEKVGFKKASVTGGLGGFIAALAGVGGGVVMVPVLNLWYRIPIIRTVSISSLAIVIISLSGWLQFAFAGNTGSAITGYTLGFVDFGTAFPLIIGSLIGGFFGVIIGKNIPQKKLQIGFSFFVMIIAASMVYKLF